MAVGAPVPRARVAEWVIETCRRCGLSVDISDEGAAAEVADALTADRGHRDVVGVARLDLPPDYDDG